mmetsp:Transcript_43041/g.121975  ORF Transcript_43041/g.121975 Transcript_43041/m.121975 type:complete len:85 (+) Transcript_43041:295-549(+)
MGADATQQMHYCWPAPMMHLVDGLASRSHTHTAIRHSATHLIASFVVCLTANGAWRASPSFCPLLPALVKSRSPARVSCAHVCM